MVKELAVAIVEEPQKSISTARVYAWSASTSSRALHSDGGAARARQAWRSAIRCPARFPLSTVLM
jgi:hypothetical protein